MMLTSFLLVTALHAQPTAVLLPQAPQQTPADTAEGLEILRRILVDSLERTFQPERKERQITMNDGRTETRGIVQLLWAGEQTVDHSRVFHLPGAGVFFSLDASLPMVEKKSAKKEEPVGDAPRDDEWEKYRREVRGGGEAGLPAGVYTLNTHEGVEMEIDPTAVDKLIDTSLQALARHAARIEGLGSQDMVTLAVRISGGYGGGHFWGTSLLEEAQALDGQKSAEEPAEQGIARLPGFSSVFMRSDSASQNLVLQIRVGDLAAYTNGGIGELRKRARINRY